MTSYTNPYTGQTINPSQVGYEQLTISSNTQLEWPINGNLNTPIANIMDIVATTTGLSVLMPSAMSASVGASFLVRNTGSNSFTVTDESLNQIVVVAPGIVQFVYLTNNATANGSWETVQFGASVAAANATALAGNGLLAIGTELNTATQVYLVSSDYAMTANDRSSFYVWNGGTGFITLPSSSSVGAEWYAIIKNDGTGILTINPSGADTIDGQPNFQLQIGESFVVVTNGSNFYSYAYGRSATFFFTQLLLTVTGGTVTLTSSQASNVIQEYQGILTSNCTIILPSTVQLYSLKNNTTGAFTLTFQTVAVGGTTITLPQGQTILAICDGINVYNAQTATSSTFARVQAGNGTSSAPSYTFTSDLATGVYLVSTSTLGFAGGGGSLGSISPSGMMIPVGINGGSF
jgi:hypothetical protein